MNDLNNIIELILKIEDLTLRVEEVSETQKKNSEDFNATIVDISNVLGMMQKINNLMQNMKKDVEFIERKVKDIDPDSILHDIDRTLNEIDIVFDVNEISKTMNTKLVQLFEDIHLNKFSDHINSHMNEYKEKCEHIDTSINKLNHINNEIEKHMPDFELVRKKDHTVLWYSLLVGILSGSILTYLIIKF